MTKEREKNILFRLLFHGFHFTKNEHWHCKNKLNQWVALVCRLKLSGPAGGTGFQQGEVFNESEII